MSLGLDYDAAARAAAEHLRTSSGRVRLHKTTSNLFRSRTATEPGALPATPTPASTDLEPAA